MSPLVHLEPIGETIDCGEDETILDAAFRQGFNLVYGCREGQCSACKCFLLEGEVALRRYSTFALSDSEEAAGYSLLCRAMPDADEITVELLHFDADDLRLENPPRDGRASVTAITAVTHDIRRLELDVLEPASLDFRPGQYVDLWVPGGDSRRSFSMANLPGEGRLELLVKCYPGGRFSGLLTGGALSAGDEIGFTGPFGAFHLRPGDGPAVLVAGGSGMAPVLSVLRQLSALRSPRPVRFFYGARARRDLFALDTIAELGAGLPDFEFVPVLSEPDASDAWSGETGLVHEALDRHLQRTDGSGAHGYMCGPPPMIDAAGEILSLRHGVDERDIHSDRFTVAADAAQEAPA